MDSRERMLTAIGGGRPDRVPLSFMIFAALRGRTSGWRDFIEMALGLGLDAVVDLIEIAPEEPAEVADARSVPVHFSSDVRIRQWRQAAAPGGYPVLHKEYQTPAGTLTLAVEQTDDWPYGDHVPFLDDFIEPRAVEFPVRGEEHLAALEHLLGQRRTIGRSPAVARSGPSRSAWPASADCCWWAAAGWASIRRPGWSG